MEKPTQGTTLTADAPHGNKVRAFIDNWIDTWMQDFRFRYRAEYQPTGWNQDEAFIIHILSDPDPHGVSGQVGLLLTLHLPQDLEDEFGIPVNIKRPYQYD